MYSGGMAVICGVCMRLCMEGRRAGGRHGGVWRALAWQVYEMDALTKQGTMPNVNAIHYGYLNDCITYSMLIHSQVYII